MFLRDGLNSRTRPRFNALSIPMRAIMVGPLSSTTISRASTAACHLSSSCSALALLDVFGGVVQRNEMATAGQGNGIVEGAGSGHSGQFVGAQALTYVKSTSINLMAGIPSYFSGSNPYLSNLRLAARSTCDLN